MALVPVEDLPNNLVTSNELPLGVTTNIVPDDDLPGLKRVYVIGHILSEPHLLDQKGFLLVVFI